MVLALDRGKRLCQLVTASPSRGRHHRADGGAPFPGMSLRLVVGFRQQIRGGDRS